MSVSSIGPSANSNAFTQEMFEQFSLDLIYQQMFRDAMDQNEDSSPIVNSEIAKIIAHSLSGWNPAGIV
jgi:hypothetical protein